MNKEQIEHLFINKNLHKLFGRASGSPADLNLSAEHDYFISIENQDKADYITASYILAKNINQISMQLVKTNLDGHITGGNRWKRIQAQILEGRTIPNRDLLQYIFTYCSKIDLGFPTLTFEEETYESFGKVLFQEFFNLDLFYSDMIDTLGNSVKTRLKITKIQDYIASQFFAGDSKIVSRQIIARLKEFNELYLSSNRERHIFWEAVIGTDGGVGVWVHPEYSLFQISPKIRQFQEQFSYLADSLRSFGAKTARKYANSRRKIQWDRYYQTITEFIGGKDDPSIIFQEDTSIIDGKPAQVMRCAFEYGDHHVSIRKSQLMAVENINQEIFKLFAIMEIGDPIEHCNAWNHRTYQNELTYKPWDSDLTSSDNFILPNIRSAIEVRGFGESSNPWVNQRNIKGFMHLQDSFDIFRLDATHKVRLLNRFEAQFINFFTTQLTQDGQKVFQIRSDSKVWNMRGDEISKKLKGLLNNLATADPLWLLKKERIRPGVYKGIMPDVGLALCTKDGSTFNLDTLLFTEIIDYARATFAWYCRQKQFDAKAMNEAGIPYFGTVKAPKHVSWFFQFPLTELTFNCGSDRITVPRYLGYQCPLITLEQAAKLGAIFKASNLFWDGHNINTYSFEYIVRHLDLIVVENREAINSQTENLIDAFIPEDALQIMQQFGVNPETRIAGEDVFFTLVEYIFGENGLGQEIGAMEVTVNHHQFWENIRAIQSMVGSALATQIIQTYFMTPSLGVKR